MFSLKDYITASGKYLERMSHPELTPEIKTNAKLLLSKLEELLDDDEIDIIGKELEFTSGWRPSAINSSVVGAAKKSAHLTGEAGDIENKDKWLSNQITVELLEKYDLYMEDPNYTDGWVHISTRAPKSGKRIFIP